MAAKIFKKDFESLKFRHDFHVKELNYDMFKKGKEIKLILFWGEEEGHFFDIPRIWIIRNGLTLFKGDINNKEELELICRLVHV